MTKDPAILFYTSDFLTGTMTMTHEHIGMYIRLLCLQHQRGRLSDKDMLYICSTYVEDVYKKFVQDENGLYYNNRMEKEITKRKKYSESRRKNVNNRYKSKSDKDINDSTYVVHMENENEDINVNVNKDKNEKEIHTIISYFNSTIGKNLSLSPVRKKIISARLKEGRTVEEMKQAINNFSQDNWNGRKKYCDIVYCLGVRSGVDNLDRWLNSPPEVSEIEKKLRRLQ